MKLVSSVLLLAAATCSLASASAGLRGGKASTAARVLMGQNSEWPNYQGNAQHSSSVNIDIPTTAPTASWTADVVPGGWGLLAFPRPPVIGGGKAFIHTQVEYGVSTTEVLTAIDVKTGATAWTTFFNDTEAGCTGDAYPTGGLVYDEGYVYLAIRNEEQATLASVDAATGAYSCMCIDQAQGHSFSAMTISQGNIITPCVSGRCSPDSMGQKKNQGVANAVYSDDYGPDGQCVSLCALEATGANPSCNVVWETDYASGLGDAFPPGVQNWNEVNNTKVVAVQSFKGEDGVRHPQIFTTDLHGDGSVNWRLNMPHVPFYPLNLYDQVPLILLGDLAIFTVGIQTDGDNVVVSRASIIAVDMSVDEHHVLWHKQCPFDISNGNNHRCLAVGSYSYRQGGGGDLGYALFYINGANLTAVQSYDGSPIPGLSFTIEGQNLGDTLMQNIIIFNNFAVIGTSDNYLVGFDLQQGGQQSTPAWSVELPTIGTDEVHLAYSAKDNTLVVVGTSGVAAFSFDAAPVSSDDYSE